MDITPSHLEKTVTTVVMIEGNRALEVSNEQTPNILLIRILNDQLEITSREHRGSAVRSGVALPLDVLCTIQPVLFEARVDARFAACKRLEEALHRSIAHFKELLSQD